MTNQEFNKHTDLFNFCEIASKIITDGQPAISAGSKFEALIFAVARAMYNAKNFSWSSDSEKTTNFMFFMLHQQAIKVGFDSHVAGNFVEFLHKRYLTYLREYVNIMRENANDLYPSPSVMAYSFFVEPFKEDRICSKVETINLLKKKVRLFDMLLERNIKDFM
jgi:hypothetical protein